MNKSSKHPTNWDLTPLFASTTDPAIDKCINAQMAAVNSFAAKWQPRGDYLTNPLILKSALDEFETLMRTHGTHGKVSYFFHLLQYQNQADPKVKARTNQLDELTANLDNQLEFFLLKIGKIPSKQQSIFLSEQSLQPYHYFLKHIFATAQYDLTEAEEKILNLVTTTSYSKWVNMTTEFLSKEERFIFDESKNRRKKSFTEISALVVHPDKQVRDTAFDAYNRIVQKHVHTAEHEINAILAYEKVNDELRGIPRPDMARHLGDHIETEVVDALIQTVSDNYHLAHQYYELKARLFGVDKLNYHDRAVDYGTINIPYTFDQAVDIVRSVMENLDPFFVKTFDTMIKNGQIDVYPKKNKNNSQFCITNGLNEPTYIQLNFTNRFDSVLTIAHEMGHAINSALMRQKQNALYFETPLSTAEVASTFMEDFVLSELAQNADDETRLALMMKKLSDDFGSIFSQVSGYRFEQELHTKFRQTGYLAASDIATLFTKHRRDYVGDAVLINPGCENWWVSWPHLRWFFYIYSYASGLLISKSLQAKVRADHTFIQQVKDFLAVGTSASPKSTFLKLGIDVASPTFWQEGLNETKNLLEETHSLAQKLGKI